MGCGSAGAECSWQHVACWEQKGLRMHRTLVSSSSCAGRRAWLPVCNPQMSAKGLALVAEERCVFGQGLLPAP